MIRGALYEPRITGMQGATTTIFSQVETQVEFSTIDREHGNSLSLVSQGARPDKKPLYFEIYDVSRLVYVMIPKGSDRTAVGAALRERFGEKTRLHFQGYPRDHEFAATPAPQQT